MEKALLVGTENEMKFVLADYNKELEIQELIKNHPSLINMSSIFDSELLVIGRETWRIDVLAMTSTCVPVIIETKKRNNHDMRDLIAQIFEYASLLQNKNYSDLEEASSRYFSSPRCIETQYKNKRFYDCFKEFLIQENDADLMDEENFQKRIEENLKSGQFYLVIVVDSLDETTRRSIDFFNSKLNKLRIEVIEIKKLKAEENSLYIPFHSNPESKKNIEKNTPGRITLDEMLAMGNSNQKDIVKEIIDTWLGFEGCMYEMGTTGLSLKFYDYSILWLFIDKMYIANPLARQLEKKGKD